MSIVVIEPHNWAIAAEAKRNGCTPSYSTYYEAFCCGCDDLLHIADQQCSAISAESARRVRLTPEQRAARVEYAQRNGLGPDYVPAPGIPGNTCPSCGHDAGPYWCDGCGAT